MVSFDPYLNWLGIPPHEQPVNFYRLLGVVLFESSPEVIEQAADRQSLRVGGFQAGPNGEMCQQLLSEIAMARFCLLDPQQKAAYDNQLSGSLAQRGERLRYCPAAPIGLAIAAIWLPGRHGFDASAAVPPVPCHCPVLRRRCRLRYQGISPCQARLRCRCHCPSSR